MRFFLIYSTAMAVAYLASSLWFSNTKGSLTCTMCTYVLQTYCTSSRSLDVQFTTPRIYILETNLDIQVTTPRIYVLVTSLDIQFTTPRIYVLETSIDVQFTTPRTHILETNLDVTLYRSLQDLQMTRQCSSNKKHNLQM